MSPQPSPSETVPFDAHVMTALIISIPTLILVSYAWPWALPFSVWSLWVPHGNPIQWVTTVWPIFLFGMIHTAWEQFESTEVYKPFNTKHPPGLRLTLIAAAGVSVWNGFWEEVQFRWILFLGSIPLLHMAGYLFFGWAGVPLLEWGHTFINAPLVHFLTFGFLSPFLSHPHGWTFGISLITTNTFFLQGHRRFKLIGTIGVWYIGLALFLVALTYGLPAAILIHVLYNLMVHTIGILIAHVRGLLA